jgi:hypothetical protein
MLNLQRSNDDLAILQAGKEIGESIADLKEPIELKIAVILKTMNSNFLHEGDKKTENLSSEEFQKHLVKFI